MYEKIQHSTEEWKETPYGAFFYTHPHGKNYKLWHIQKKDKSKITYKITWFAGQPCYVHFVQEKEIFVGAMDLHNNCIWTSPASLGSEHPIFVTFNKILKLFKNSEGLNSFIFV
jgi:hypothetical protein